MITDPLIEELHQIRDRLAAKFNYDVFAIAADARARQAHEEHPIVSFEQPEYMPAIPAVTESEKDRQAA
jgi:hypothetical protein